MGHVTYFWNFRTPSISRELFKLETSHLAGKITTRVLTKETQN